MDFDKLLPESYDKQPESNPLNKTYCVETNSAPKQEILHQDAEKESTPQTDSPKKPKDTSQKKRKRKKKKKIIKKETGIDTIDNPSPTQARTHNTVYFINSHMQGESKETDKTKNTSKRNRNRNRKRADFKITNVGTVNSIKRPDLSEKNTKVKFEDVPERSKRKHTILTNNKPENGEKLSEGKTFPENDQYSSEIRVQKVKQPHFSQEVTTDAKNIDTVLTPEGKDDFPVSQNIGQVNTDWTVVEYDVNPKTDGCVNSTKENNSRITQFMKTCQQLSQDYNNNSENNREIGYAQQNCSQKVQDSIKEFQKVPETVSNQKIGRPHLTGKSVDFKMEAQYWTQMECEEEEQQDTIKEYQKVPEDDKNGRPHLSRTYSVDYAMEAQYLVQMEYEDEQGSIEGYQKITDTARQYLYTYNYNMPEMRGLETICEEPCPYTSLPEAYPNLADIDPKLPKASVNSPKGYPNLVDGDMNFPEAYIKSPQAYAKSPKTYANSSEIDPRFFVALEYSNFSEADPKSPVVNPNLAEMDPNLAEMDPNLAEMDPNLPELDPNGYGGGEARWTKERDVYTDQGRVEHIWSEDVLRELDTLRTEGIPPPRREGAPGGWGAGDREVQWVEPDRLLEWLLTKEPAYKDSSPLETDMDTFSDSFIEFMRGAHCNPHSTEIELIVEDSFELPPAITLTSAGLAAKGRHHAKAIRALAKEITAREKIMSSKDTPALAITMEPHSHQSSSYEEFPTRDIGLLPECFLAGSHRNHPDYVHHLSNPREKPNPSNHQLNPLEHLETVTIQPKLFNQPVYPNQLEYPNHYINPIQPIHPNKLDHPGIKGNRPDTATNYPNLDYPKHSINPNQPIHPNQSDHPIYPGIKANQSDTVTNYPNNLEQPIYPGIKTDHPGTATKYSNYLDHRDCPNRLDHSDHLNRFQPSHFGTATNHPNHPGTSTNQNHSVPTTNHLLTATNHSGTATNHSGTVTNRPGTATNHSGTATNQNHSVSAPKHPTTSTIQVLDWKRLAGGDSNEKFENEENAIWNIEGDTKGMCGLVGRGRGRLHTENTLSIGRGRGRIGTYTEFR